MSVTPYKAGTAKKEQVERMFDNIAHRYDFVNNFLSLGIDILWRKKAIRLLSEFSPARILDVATGTGEFAIEALALKPTEVIGVDLSEGMLQKGREKLARKGLDKKIELIKGDSEKLPFPDDRFDAVTVGFGVRNFEDLQKGLSDIYRVLSPGGILVVLEFSKPVRFPVKQVYNFYFKRICPFFGRLFSKDASAYTYLYNSVQAFPDGKEFEEVMKKSGFTPLKSQTVSGGIATIYLGKK